MSDGRALRDGADLFLRAEREGAGTLHVLGREEGRLGLVRDESVLRRVALRLEILRRAMEGELVEWTDPEGRKRFLGAFHRGEVAGELSQALRGELAVPREESQ